MKKRFSCIIFLLVLLFGTVLMNDSYCSQDSYFSHTYKYKVRKGDNLQKVGLRFDVPWRKIAELNNIPNERVLPVGKKLIVKKQFPYSFPALTSWYGKPFHGRKTANGEVYNMYGISAAHKTLPLGTMVVVSNPKNGRELKLKINDRGPYIKGRSLDLSFAAAKYLGIIEQGVAPLLVKILK